MDTYAYIHTHVHVHVARAHLHLDYMLHTSDHGYWTLWMLMVKLKAFTLKEANEMIANAPISTWSDGVAPPALHKFTLKGAQNGKPKKTTPRLCRGRLDRSRQVLRLPCRGARHLSRLPCRGARQVSRLACRGAAEELSAWSLPAPLRAHLGADPG